ncbi:coenzyme F420-0:L-glutamate ligase [Nesterenkonia sp. NBAIMH1]|uniref:coenzyme F420-0:L-glutamate ligase n=1 Tax=Nesterenkonia sp. NBAIMH1 TaxID=2600320 RepID=UPI0011B56585|nr:coenzyme F420-0:L-glutamate ligase [Nesterenkonia sp. NBAIMH1]
MADHQAVGPVTAWAVPGIPEVRPHDDLPDLILDALAKQTSAGALADGDILVVTSKVVSKAEGRVIAAQDREAAITAETVREVASRPRADGEGRIRIVENRLGIVAAAAGVDASNTADGTVLLLPEDPDASAARLRLAAAQRLGVSVGVLISDTLGRAWRMGQTDAAIGASGVRVLYDHRGGTDSAGKELTATSIAAGDEICAAADLVKGKAAGLPVAVVRGLGHLLDPDAPGARSLVRTGPEDMFRLGTDEAIAEGYRRAYEESAVARDSAS